MDEQLNKHLSNIVEKIRDILNTPLYKLNEKIKF